jgi:hypothetical protein
VSHFRGGLRVELATAGIDDAYQGITSDPSGASASTATGLRIPSFLPAPIGRTRYLFLLATRTLNRTTRIRGLRQYLTLGTQSTDGDGGQVTQTLEFPIVTPTFCCPDGNVSWHLVIEPNVTVINQQPTTDNVNLMAGNAEGPCLLYQTIGWSGAQSQYYWEDLNLYTPPNLYDKWQPVGGLGNFHDVRFPWLSAQAWNAVDVILRAQSDMRVSFYASVLQTAGLQPPNTGDEDSFALGLAPENGFASGVSELSSTPQPIFWRVGGAIVFEDEET